MKYYIISAILHILMIISLGFIQVGGEPLFKQLLGNKHNQFEHNNNGEDDVIIEISESDESGNKVKCDNYFYGIGITQEEDGIISQVFKGYPAYEHGLMVGDKISCNEEIRGFEPKMLSLTIERKGKIFKINIMRGKICIENN